MKGAFTKKGEQYVLSFQRRLAHPPAKVWRALTEGQLIRQWFPCDIVGEWRVGEKLQFIFLHGEGETLTEKELRGEVLTVETERLLEFSWGDHLFKYELFLDGEACMFHFSEKFSDSTIGARNAAGWELCFENMDRLLHGAEIAKFVYAEWYEKFASYSSKFEPEMGTQQGAPKDHPEIPAE